MDETGREQQQKDATWAAGTAAQMQREEMATYLRTTAKSQEEIKDAEIKAHAGYIDHLRLQREEWKLDRERDQGKLMLWRDDLAKSEAFRVKMLVETRLQTTALTSIAKSLRAETKVTSKPKKRPR